MSDYSAHTVALQHLVYAIRDSLRDKKLAEADEACKEAMKRLCRIHEHINGSLRAAGKTR